MKEESYYDEIKNLMKEYFSIWKKLKKQKKFIISKYYKAKS